MEGKWQTVSGAMDDASSVDNHGSVTNRHDTRNDVSEQAGARFLTMLLSYREGARRNFICLGLVDA